MKVCTRFALMMLSFVFSEAFVKPMILRSKSIPLYRSMTKHNFMDFAKTITVADKYFLIHSLINQVVLNKNALLFDYCNKNLNYTDVMHVIISPELETIIRRHYSTNTTLELYDIICSKSDDCFIDVYKLGNISK